MSELISSTNNPLVKQIRALREKKGRDETGLFLVEGIHHIGDAIEAGWEIEILAHAPQLLTSEFGRKIVADHSQRGGRVAVLTGELFGSLAEKENPQGLLAVVHQRHIQLEQAPLTNLHFAAALVSPQDPGNVGAILRTLDAVGAQALFLLDGGVDPYNPSCVRASMGAIFWKPIVKTSFREFMQWTKKHLIHVIGTSAHAKVDFHEMSCMDTPIMLLFGSEQKGLSAEQLDECSMTVSVPMRGRGSSLNLAVAAGIMLYALVDRR